MVMKHLLLLVGVVLLAAACSMRAEEFIYCNPNAQLKMRDTHIIPNPDDGKFYAVGTLFWGYKDPDGNAGFRLYVSDNLKDWEPGPWIMKQSEIPEEAWYRKVFWAPEIHKINGMWYFTYNCDGIQEIDRERYGSPHGAGISVADKITGPYRALSHDPLAPWPHNDLTLFQDEDGKVYAFFNNGHFNRKNHPELLHSIFVAEADLDTGTLKEQPHKLLTQQERFESHLIEGAHVLKTGGIYYLFYSGYDEKGYAVGYATAKNVYGPYTRAENVPLFGARHDGALLQDGKTLYDVDHPYREVGHNQVFKGPDGRYWTSCHAYVKGGDDKFGALLVYDPLEFRNGVITSPAPTWTTQAVRIDPEMLELFPGLAN
jgi:xylan 1,4-beta-xylosidase